jgi:hypothetical protein
MTLRAAGADDLPALTAFLRRHEATSMFPLSNLAGAGLHGAGFYGMRVWIMITVRGMALGLIFPCMKARRLSAERRVWWLWQRA